MLGCCYLQWLCQSQVAIFNTDECPRSVSEETHSGAFRRLAEGALSHSRTKERVRLNCAADSVEDLIKHKETCGARRTLQRLPKVR